MWRKLNNQYLNVPKCRTGRCQKKKKGKSFLNERKIRPETNRTNSGGSNTENATVKVAVRNAAMQHVCGSI